MFRISKEFHFSAAHQLHGLDGSHPCSRLHGHNYVLVVHLKSQELNETGFVEDYNNLGIITQYIEDKIDHRNLNDVMHPLNSTSENLARMIYDHLKPSIPKLYAVEIKETPKTTAIYEPAGK